MREKIQEQLRRIEESENIKILLAVESGSRAWGFASPDSDYDVRFVYIRRPEDYLRLDVVRDVIELPIDDVLDINGWDLQKTLRLLHKSNPTLFEWFSSPIVYQKTEFADKFRELMMHYFSSKGQLSGMNITWKDDGELMIMEFGDGQVSGLQQIEAKDFYQSFEQEERVFKEAFF